MKTRHAPDRKKRSMTVGVLTGILIFAFITVAGAILLTSLLIGDKLSLDAGKYILYFVLMLSAFLGAITAGKMIGEKRLLVCGVIAAVILFVLVGVNILFYDGQFHGLGMTVLMVLTGCTLANVVSLKGKGNKLRRRKSYSR